MVKHSIATWQPVCCHLSAMGGNLTEVVLLLQKNNTAKMGKYEFTQYKTEEVQVQKNGERVCTIFYADSLYRTSLDKKSFKTLVLALQHVFSLT